MNEVTHASSDEHRACVVLMFKAPSRSKQRLTSQIGSSAIAVADCLFACAIEDLNGWQGPVCFAPASDADTRWLAHHYPDAELVEEQGDGNLGERIEHVNSILWGQGFKRQIFIGIDCPALTPKYIEDAESKLDNCEVVLGPAEDGGVVLMGSCRPWPKLGDLRWSTIELKTALSERCSSQDLRVTETGVLMDVDTASDLRAAGAALADDQRAARRALHSWIDDNHRKLAETRE